METNPIKHITSKFIPPVLLSDIPELSISNIDIRYMGSKTQSFPYPFSIEVVNTIIDHEDNIVFETTIKSDYILYGMVTKEEMYDAHIETIGRFKKAINVNSNHSYLKIHDVPVPALNTVLELMIEAKLFDRLIIGLMLN